MDRPLPHPYFIRCFPISGALRPDNATAIARQWCRRDHWIQQGKSPQRIGASCMFQPAERNPGPIFREPELRGQRTECACAGNLPFVSKVNRKRMQCSSPSTCAFSSRYLRMSTACPMPPRSRSARSAYKAGGAGPCEENSRYPTHHLAPPGIIWPTPSLAGGRKRWNSRTPVQK
jgi:hypothetical protein